MNAAGSDWQIGLLLFYTTATVFNHMAIVVEQLAWSIKKQGCEWSWIGHQNVLEIQPGG